MKKQFTTLLTAGLLTACGGGGSGSSSSDGNTNPGGSTPEITASNVGVLSDSPVAGVSYLTSPSGSSGVTNALGEYGYEEGDIVQFSIGGIQFPPVPAKGKVTPLDMGGDGATLATPSVVNVLRLLQSLDEDGDPDNGITVSQATSTALIDTVLDFEAGTFESEANTAVGVALNRTLITENEAISHFEGSLRNDLLGSWIYTEPNGGNNVLTFFGDGLYVIAHSMADDGDQQAGSAEYGSYTWDPVTGDFSVTLIRESDGSGGLYDASNPAASQGIQLTVGDDALNFTLSDGEVQFTAIEDTENDLVGSWFFPESPDASVLLTFLDDQNYVLVQTNNVEAYAGDTLTSVSSEWNTYTLAASDSSFAVGMPSVETDGPGGLYNAEGNEGEVDPKLSLRTGGQLIFQPNPQESVAFADVRPFDAQLVRVDGTTTSAPVKRIYGVYTSSIAAEYNFEIPVSGQFERFAALLSDNTIEFDLEANGTGLVSFSSTSANAAEWTVATNGVLNVTETTATADVWLWEIIPIEGNVGSAIISTGSLGSAASASFIGIVNDGPATFTPEFVSGPYLLTDTITSSVGPSQDTALEGEGADGTFYSVFCRGPEDAIGIVEQDPGQLTFNPDGGSFTLTIGSGPDSDVISGSLTSDGRLSYSEPVEEEIPVEDFISRSSASYVGQYDFETGVVSGTYTSQRETIYTPEGVSASCTITSSSVFTPTQ
ncbi:hypothetical protein [Marinobacter confluentis]|uniref:Uncharacterized protein n=1 Tax=Marinobacter confluentis TaxID=1697557 RepID=A0A4Z1CCD0_9GAMM|nr:hypothetical protein [Marinobacter confluentis]TGN41856.1 hypothetical protein E5Q11_04875 [Marinobacter confluentis]